jgi:hypothetical protein
MMMWGCIDIDKPLQYAATEPGATMGKAFASARECMVISVKNLQPSDSKN